MPSLIDSPSLFLPHWTQIAYAVADLAVPQVDDRHCDLRILGEAVDGDSAAAAAGDVAVHLTRKAVESEYGFDGVDSRALHSRQPLGRGCWCVVEEDQADEGGSC